MLPSLHDNSDCRGAEFKGIFLEYIKNLLLHTSLLHASCLPSFSQFFSGKFLPRIIHSQLPLKQNGSATVTIPSSLDKMEHFTVCARFKTYYFLDIYTDIVYGQSSSIQVVLYFGEWNPFIFFSQVTEKLQGGRKDILGCYYYKGNTSCFSVWKPNIWNKFCLMMDKQKKTLQVSLNERQNISITDHQLPDVNNKILLMNNKVENLWNPGIWGPVHGAITDFNVWDRIIEESKDFPNDIDHEPGNILSWETAEVDTNLLTDTSDVVFLDNPKFEVFREECRSMAPF